MPKGEKKCLRRLLGVQSRVIITSDCRSQMPNFSYTFCNIPQNYFRSLFDNFYPQFLRLPFCKNRTIFRSVLNGISECGSVVTLALGRASKNEAIPFFGRRNIDVKFGGKLYGAECGIDAVNWRKRSLIFEGANRPFHRFKTRPFQRGVLNSASVRICDYSSQRKLHGHRVARSRLPAHGRAASGAHPGVRGLRLVVSLRSKL